MGKQPSMSDHAEQEYVAAMEYVAQIKSPHLLIIREMARKLFKRTCIAHHISAGHRRRKVKQIARCVLAIDGRNIYGARRP